MPIKVKVPLEDETITHLKAGDQVLLSGTVYTARDAAHKRMCEQLKKGEDLPFNLSGQVIYYVGPTPAKENQIIGSAGPTTSERMDKYTPELLRQGLKGMIGKGYRNQEVKEAIVKHKAVYFGAVGGSGALLSRAIKSSKVIAYDDLRTEAIRLLKIEDFPAVVINDCFGNDWYTQAIEIFKQE